MKLPPGFSSTGDFAPQEGDSLARLLEKTEAQLWYLRANEPTLNIFPTSFVEERRAAQTELAALLRRALADPALEDDARLEAHRVWAEECHISALWTVTNCKHIRAPESQARFIQEGITEWAEAFEQTLEAMRPAAMKFLSTEDMNWLRENGFLRWNE